MLRPSDIQIQTHLNNSSPFLLAYLQTKIPELQPYIDIIFFNFHLHRGRIKVVMIKLFVTAVAITVALTIAISTKNIDVVEEKNGTPAAAAAVVPSRKVSRFLAEEKNPRAADHCKRDNEICYVLEGKNSTCCNNKCMNLAYDRHNCGACKNKCKFTSTCCGGECVNLSFDKRHCGACGNRCMHGGYCIYGMCDYA